MYKKLKKIAILVKQTFFCKQKTIPNKPSKRSDNIYLVSFPKSGNTWVRFILGNIYNHIEEKVEEVNFHSIHSLIPEKNQGALNFRNLPQIFKTHDSYDNNNEKVILLLRNPFDTLYSYYKFLNKESGISISLTNTIHSEQYGINPIIDHTNSYTKNCDEVLIVTYEDMKSIPVKTVYRICNFLKIKVGAETVSDAIEKSSFQSMRKIELTTGRKFGNKDFLFTRKGEIGEGLKEISSADVKYIRDMLAKSPVLDLLYN